MLSPKDQEIIDALARMQSAVLASRGTAADARRRSALQSLQRLVDPRRAQLEAERAERQETMRVILEEHDHAREPMVLHANEAVIPLSADRHIPVELSAEALHQTHELNTQEVQS